MSQLKRDMEELETLRRSLAEFFCEDGNTFKIEECFKIFHQFCLKFNQAVAENERRRIQEEQVLARRKQREEQLLAKKRLCTSLFLLRILFSLLFVFLFKANKLIKTIHFIFCICIHNIFFTVTNNQQIEAPISESECNLINYDPFDFATGLPQRNYSRSDIKVLY